MEHTTNFYLGRQSLKVATLLDKKKYIVEVLFGQPVLLGFTRDKSKSLYLD